MLTPFPLLALPAEIRLRIYEAHFSASIVRLRATPTPFPHIPRALSLILTCKLVRSESAPLLYPHALFWVDSIQALITLVRHHSAAQLFSIQHFAIRNSLVPLPQGKSAHGGGDPEERTVNPIRDILYRAFYEQICLSLQTLVLFNTTNPEVRRRILEQQAGRTFQDEEFDAHCFDGMRLKAHLLVPVLKEMGIVLGPKKLGSKEDVIPFEIMLRFSGGDGMVCAL